jgi:hypothetical protein
MQIESLDPEKFYRTDDMAMATFLKMEGFTAQQVGWIGDTCYWWFNDGDALADCIEVFHNGEASVEPREYSRVYGLSKAEFYDAKNARTAAAAS